MNHIQQAQEKVIDALWEKHCLQGDEINPTDRMFYEQFHDACNALIKATERATEERIVGEIEKLDIQVGSPCKPVANMVKTGIIKHLQRRHEEQ